MAGYDLEDMAHQEGNDDRSCQSVFYKGELKTDPHGLFILKKSIFSELCKKLLNQAICSRIRGDLKRASAKGL